MAPARNRRRLPTPIDRGIGLLEVILPRGTPSETVTALPAGQRDSGGFWFPAGYSHPGDIFTPAQRRLQAKQRQVQLVRHGKRAKPPANAPEPERLAQTERPQTDSVSASELSDARAVVVASASAASGLADRALPLPPPAFEAPGRDDSPLLGGTRTRPTPATLAAASQYVDRQPQRAAPPPVVVDSRKGSD